MKAEKAFEIKRRNTMQIVISGISPTDLNYKTYGETTRSTLDILVGDARSS